jgi:hypothetical protein
MKMSTLSKMTLLAAAAVTLSAIVVWQTTGGDWYTKYQVVEQVESEPDPNDPLVAAGFYDGGSTSQTLTRDEFRLGLLPTPAGILDKHAISVASVAGPVWALGLGVVWFERRRTKTPGSTK